MRPDPALTRFETGKGSVEIRELDGLAEVAAGVSLQERIWGAAVCPKELLIPSQHEGGLLAGAFSSSGELVGMVYSFPTCDPAIQHSHILATLEAWRGLGIGARLKWFQRQWCLERGIARLRWTVDPLRAANAELNIRHLGGTASTYYPDYYGEMQGIDAGAPSDRLLLEWDLASPRVTARSACVPVDAGFPQAANANRIIGDSPVDPDLNLSNPEILVHLPEDFISLCRSNRDLALEWRHQDRQLLTHYFNHGYNILEFTRVDGPAYLLKREAFDQ